MTAPERVEAAIWRLAEELYGQMERLDPAGDTWADEPDSGRRIWYAALEAMLTRSDDVLQALGDDLVAAREDPVITDEMVERAIDAGNNFMPFGDDIPERAMRAALNAALQEPKE